MNLESSVNINNSGSIDAEEVVKVYLTVENENEALPLSFLVKFKRVNF